MIDAATDDQRRHFAQQGYVVVRDAIDQGQIQAAAAAVEEILDRAVAGDFGDQFRWTDEDQRVPGFINDLLAPSKYHSAFGDLLDSVLLPYTESLLQKPVRCSWLLMLTAGASQPYSVNVHRDNSELGGDNESELLELYRMNQCYFQAPLMPDDHFLQVIPGSHLRLATEREISVANSAEPSVDVPGLITIDLQPGDVVYRQTNLIHQGWNPEGLPRRTLVSNFWSADLPIQPIEPHDHEAIGTPGFIERLPPRCQRSARRYLEAYEQSEGQVASSAAGR